METAGDRRRKKKNKSMTVLFPGEFVPHISTEPHNSPKPNRQLTATAPRQHRTIRQKLGGLHRIVRRTPLILPNLARFYHAFRSGSNHRRGWVPVIEGLYLLDSGPYHNYSGFSLLLAVRFSLTFCDKGELGRNCCKCGCPVKTAGKNSLLSESNHAWGLSRVKKRGWVRNISIGVNFERSGAVRWSCGGSVDIAVANAPGTYR